MTERPLTAQIRSQPGLVTIDLVGEINSFAEETLRRAFHETEQMNLGTILLNMSRVSYINSTGIALIVGLLAKARKSDRKLAVCGLSDHYQEIFKITRLDEFMAVYADEASAERAAVPSSR